MPFKDWIYHGNYQWGISKDINLFDKTLTIGDKYNFLYHNKGSYDGYNQKLIRESKYLVDKTEVLDLNKGSNSNIFDKYIESDEKLYSSMKEYI